MSRKPTIALFATWGARLGNSKGMRTGARRPSPHAPVSRPPSAALSARLEYTRYEGHPTPCRTTAWTAKPIDQDSRDTA